MSKDTPDELSAETIGVNFARRHGIEGNGAEALAKLRALSAAEIPGEGQTAPSIPIPIRVRLSTAALW